MGKKKINRKTFVKQIGIGAVLGTSIIGCKSDKPIEDGPNIITNKKHKWKMVTTWPPNFPVLGEACNLFADMVNTMSNGRLEIKVYGGGDLVPALEAFEAVSSGAAEMGSGAAYYWAGRSPATQFFATVPFGMNAQQVNAWLYSGGGMELWKELYAQFNLVPFAGGNTGVQMAGWFNREMNEISDFEGLKMRMPGLGGKVINELGATAVLVPGSELYTSLERGIIDATEWIGPYHDYKMGFHDIAKYYYSPGWHEPGTILEFFINKRTYDKLDSALQKIVEIACSNINIWMLSEFEAKNNFYLQKLIKEEQVDVRQLNKEILKELKTVTQDVLYNITSKNPVAQKIYDSYVKFQKDIDTWGEYSEKSFHLNVSSI